MASKFELQKKVLVSILKMENNLEAQSSNQMIDRFCYVCSRTLIIGKIGFAKVMKSELIMKLDILKPGIKLRDYVCQRCSLKARRNFDKLNLATDQVLKEKSSCESNDSNIKSSN